MNPRLILFSIPAAICIISMTNIYLSSAPKSIRLIFCTALCIPLLLAAVSYFNPGYLWEVIHG
ncbi:hypothetical protein [Desulfonema limicola]|uniref:hypothetical protein n=1 Tax=Desulfonema limicola TaxID=45656 RepID=UPI001A9B716D|nr:hypothetical protein [Desulfonema limicola]